MLRVGVVGVPGEVNSPLGAASKRRADYFKKKKKNFSVRTQRWLTLKEVSELTEALPTNHETRNRITRDQKDIITTTGKSSAAGGTLHGISCTKSERVIGQTVRIREIESRIPQMEDHLHKALRAVNTQDHQLFTLSHI